VLEAVRDRALTYAATQPLDLPGVLSAEVRDWHIYDSTTVRLDDALKDEYPGAGDYAALKIHKRFSVGLGTTIAYRTASIVRALRTADFGEGLAETRS